MEQQAWVRLYDHIQAYNRLVDSEGKKYPPTTRMALSERRELEGVAFLEMAREDVANGDYHTEAEEMTSFLLDIGANPKSIAKADEDEIEDRYTRAIGYGYKQIYEGRERIALPSRESIRAFIANYNPIQGA